ncbi:hypothetical protein GS429_09120 [Natronorubrum sp. JWXQ-INN-674]|uniref:Uncharacterized protein n=1 Tax=Natronorubrum halalkaliphilum TaxID=2691917 RepID=A0A6B0VL09_9EURY|nr:hypothetical protein [Natronorubrum halalkaliphilum]MXV62218.1 hypothetical protein [Natronorubrum halalkaliphilum]
MTSIRDVLGESLAIGERFSLSIEERDGTLVADHPYDSSPMDVAVVEGLDRLPEHPPTEPVEVELLGRIVDGRIAGRVVGTGAGEPVDDATGDT